MIFFKELELYKPELIEKPSLILINKMDVEGAEEKFEEIKGHLKNLSSEFSLMKFLMHLLI